MKLYVVTNMTSESNYTPSVFIDRQKAMDWMVEGTVNNLIGVSNVDIDDNDLYEKTPREILDYVQNLKREQDIGCIVTINLDGRNPETYVEYPDDSFNYMQLFEYEVEV